MTKKLYTIGEVATLLGIPTHRAQYLVDSRQIAPTQRAGHFRMFDHAAVDRMAREVARLRAEREEVARDA